MAEIENEMRLITKKIKAHEAITEWRQTYDACGEPYETTTKALLALKPEEVTAETVDKITGNDSWTRIVCDVCNQDVSSVTEFGPVRDMFTQTAHVCLPCLEREP